jgi:hypothetical protein
VDQPKGFSPSHHESADKRQIGRTATGNKWLIGGPKDLGIGSWEKS